MSLSEGAVVGVYGRTGQIVWILLEILVALVLVKLVVWFLGIIVGCIGDTWSERLFSLVGLGIVGAVAFFFIFI